MVGWLNAMELSWGYENNMGNLIHARLEAFSPLTGGMTQLSNIK